MRHIIALVTLDVCFVLGSRCLSADEKRGDSQPYLTLTGTDSRIKEPGCSLIRTEADWIKTWQRHKTAKESPDYDVFYNPLALPVVDFERCMVIAVFQGSTTNNAGLKAVSFLEGKERVVLRFENKRYQTMESARPRIPAEGVLVVEDKAEPPMGSSSFLGPTRQCWWKRVFDN